LVRSFTLPGEQVLDPVAGSGSTCIAALVTGRKYIGLEKDIAYIRVAVDRIERIHKRAADRRLA
jgi:DNA modification methylase